jgi:hypothetical protein
LSGHLIFLFKKIRKRKIKKNEIDLRFGVWGVKI